MTSLVLTPSLDEHYRVLREEVVARGLYRRAYGFYAAYCALVLIAVAVSLYVITLTTNPYIQIANAVFLAFVSVQAGMLGHDFSHQQVFKSYGLNRFFGALMWGCFVGLSESRWYERHSAHHRNPNHLEQDPDLDIPFLFSERQIAGRSRFVQTIVLPYQDRLFFFALPVAYANLLWGAWEHILTRFSARSLLELPSIFARFAVLFSIVFISLPFMTALTFLLVYFMLAGAYMSLAFAPNHKGLPIVEKGTTTWLDQIVLTRGIRPSWPTFFLMGGLNFQIEHHLFSDIARIRYWQIQPLVKKFCLENDIAYREVSWTDSMRHMHSALKQVRLAYANAR